jgi:hypothetical protein
VSANPHTKPAAARRAVVAVAVPTTMAALLCTATLAGTAFASGSTGTTATAPCSTSSTPGTPSSGASTTPAPTATTASPTATPTGTPVTQVPNNPASSPATTPPATHPASPTPSASPTATGSGNGFWGWLNGIWQWIFDGTEQLTDKVPQVAAAAALRGLPIAEAGKSAGASTESAVTESNSGKTAKTGKSDSGTTDTPTACASTSAAPLHKDEAAAAGNQAALIPWHLSTPSMTMYGLTFNGVDTVQTANGSVQVLDFTVDRVDITSMVTYSYPGGASGQRQYNNAGSGTTTVLTNVHLWTTTMTASVYGLIQVTLTPTSPITTILGVAQGFTIPIPVVFTDVNADNALLSAGGLDVPGFAGFAGS